MFVLDCDRAYLYAHPERKLTDDETARYEDAQAERIRGVPTQYITGHQEFWGMDLIVSPAVLIPRPETELLVESVLKRTPEGWPRTARVANEPERVPLVGEKKTPGLRIVDVGTGSGCVALALAKELADAEIHGVDISSAALEIANANSARHQLERRVDFHQADLLDGVDGAFDFVVSNPPYVGESEEDEVQLEVRKFEPRAAVFAGPVGTEVIARLIPQAWEKLRPGGWLIMEVSGTIADAVLGMVSEWGEVKVLSDLQGIQRVVAARKNSN